MTRTFLSATLCFLLLSYVPAHGAEPEPLPVRKVELFGSGVGYFEHGGKVEGDASVRLRFKTSQINDVLKSLILQDLDGGRVGAVVYPSKDPLEKILKSFEIDLSGNPSLARLLNTLRGASIRVTVDTTDGEGTILGLEERTRPVGEKNVLKYWVLNLLTPQGIRSFELDKIRTLELADPKLQGELEEALATIAGERGRETKTLEIRFAGKGERRVRVGYLIETPVWKVSYRLVMPPAGETEGYLQGWAIVENQTDNDWEGIDLSLVSGRPISFIQDLYQPLYLARPVVEPPITGSPHPQFYEEGVEREKTVPGRKEKRLFAKGAAPRIPAAEALPESPEADSVEKSLFALAKAPVSPESLDPAESVSAVADAAEVGELFRYAVSGVRLPRRKSAMIPIVTDPIEAERVSIYNPNAQKKYPLNGALMKNTTGKHLLQGPVTVFDENTYAGDARLGNLPPGHTRLLSYAVDLDTVIDSEKSTHDARVRSGKIVRGVLHIQRKNVASRVYRLQNKSDDDKVIIVEHPFRPSWKLVGTPEPFETTSSLYRFRVPLAASHTTDLVVREEILQEETIAILPVNVSRIEVYTRANEIPAEVRDALAEAIRMKQSVSETENRLRQLQQRIQEISKEQERIRANMTSVGDPKSSYYIRLLKKLDDQETEIETIRNERDRLQGTLEKKRRALEDYLANLTLG